MHINTSRIKYHHAAEYSCDMDRDLTMRLIVQPPHVNLFSLSLQYLIKLKKSTFTGTWWWTWRIMYSRTTSIICHILDLP